MADTQNLNGAQENAPEINVSKKEWNGAYVPKHTAILIKNGIESGKAPFLPANGRISPKAIYNANTGFPLDAKDLIPVQFEKAAKGYESNTVGTYKTMNNAGTSIKKDEHGVWFNFKGKDGELHHAAYFFGEQVENPEKFAEFASKNQKWQQRLSNETIKITNPEVSEYLASYVAACKSGAKLEVTPEVAEKFKQNILAVTENELKRTNAEKNPTIPKMTDLLFTADKKANEIVKSIEKEKGLAPEQQKKNERRVERSAAMSY